MTKQIIEGYLSRSVKDLKENSNNEYSYSHLEGKIAGRAVREYTLLEKYPSHIRESFNRGEIHIHNLTKGIIPYCFGADLKMLLLEGLITNRIVSRPAKHLDTAIDHIINYLYTTQQEFAGAQAISDVNHLLAPYVREDNLNLYQIGQNLQRVIYSFNYPGRSGFQTPFINFIFNLSCPKYLMGEPVFIQGRDTGNVYGDYQEEALMILDAFNQEIAKGDARGNPFTFPIPTLNITKDDKKYLNSNLFLRIVRSDIEYGLWYFMNYIGTGYVPGSKRNMCCRVILDFDDIMIPGGQWAFEGATGSLGVVTINLPQIGFLSGGDDMKFFELLNQRLETAKEVLLLKGELVNSSYEKGLLPISKIYHVNFNNFFRTIGMIGLDEMSMNMFGSPVSENLRFAHRILEYMKDWTRRTSKETGFWFNDEMTPGEGSSHDLVLKDLLQYPNIWHRGGKRDPYYTSLLTPPSQEMGVWERIRIEEPLLNLITGGTVHRIYHGEHNPNQEGIRKLVLKILDRKVPYFDYEREYSVCQRKGCGRKVVGEQETCTCGGDMFFYSRIVGYYRPRRFTNPGKFTEIGDRKYVSL